MNTMTRAGGSFWTMLLLATPLIAQSQPPIRGFSPSQSRIQRQLEEKLRRGPDADRLQRTHRRLTEDPHVAGTPGGRRVAEFIRKEFQASGIAAEIVEYEVLLSYPKKVELELIRPYQQKLANRETGYPEDKDTFDPNVDPPWHAYAASGRLEGEVVYVNFGRPEDYERLARLGVSVEGRIAIARYFEGYRGAKSLEAEKRGVRSLILYSDPAEDGYVQGETYPNGPWGPASHVQRGANVYDFMVPGDPLTPGWASTQGARRLEPQESRILPRIPTLPISYADAAHILKNLAGPVVPAGWQGGLPFTYHIGPGPAAVHLDLQISRETRTISDVIGRIEGSEEPEKKIILSNHHDAWVYGAVDPSSGTTTLLELARLFGELQREGWRPRRSIILAAWDAEEYTLTGSTEWGEEHADDLRRNGVACLNVDSAISGKRFSASAVPSLRAFIMGVTREVPDPRTGKSVFESWEGSSQSQNIRGYGVSGGAELPVDIGILGSGSDYTVFFNFLGIPSLDMLFDGPYGVYHSQFDDHRWMERYGDPLFQYHRAMTTIWGIMATRLANAAILPFDYSEYARDLRVYVEDLQTISGSGISFSPIMEAIDRFETAASHLTQAADQSLAGGTIPANASQVNQALLQVERDLTHPEGIPGRPWFKHLIYAPLPSYLAETLPGVREALLQGDLERAKEQADLLHTALERATRTLRNGAPR